MGMMLDTLLLTYHITGHEKYLAPLRSMAAIRLKWLDQRPSQPAESGSEAWCAERLGFLVAACAKYKVLTSSGEFDRLLAKEGYTGRVGDASAREATVRALRDNAEALRVNFEGYTSEVRYTDRVLKFPSLFAPGMMPLPEGTPAIKRPNPELLYSLATGDPGNARYFPLAAVRWLTPPQDIAAMVTETGKDRFVAELYHFGQEPRAMKAELYLLAPEAYEFVLLDGKGEPIGPATAFSVDQPRTRIEFELPARRACRLQVSRRKS
jgi:hypothetical protein